MLIWRNLDPKILAQLLVQASTLWKARNAAIRKQREGGAFAHQPIGKGRGRPAGTGDV